LKRGKNKEEEKEFQEAPIEFSEVLSKVEEK
jgi:hypothetical protein